MIEIRDLVVDFKCLSRDAFMAKHDVPMLLHQTDQAIDPTRDFKVKSIKAARKATAVALNPTLEVEVAAHVAGVLAFELRARKPGASRISVGRTDSNDIQLPYSKVSMLHAFFTRSADDSTWYLTDADSTNGTWVDRKRTSPRAPVALTSGCRLKLGTAELIFYSPAGFYEYLTRLTAKVERRP